jgi:hypothetical protein
MRVIKRKDAGRYERITGANGAGKQRQIRVTGVPPRRHEAVSRYPKRVTCTLASRYIERDAIFKLRYQAYLRAGLVSENSFGRHIEPADHAANAYLMGLCINRRLVSSLRLQIGSAAAPYFSSLELFPHVLEPVLRSRKTIIDMSRVATDGELARQYVLMPYLILRSWIMASEHFRADYIAAVVRRQHQLFYKRVLDAELHSEVRPPAHHLTGLSLVILDFASSAKRIYKNLPFLRSTPSERQQLFERDSMPPKIIGLHTLFS